MARKTYLELSSLRAHYDKVTDQVFITSTASALKRANFRLPIPKNTRNEVILKTLLRKERISVNEQGFESIHWTEDNCLAIAGKAGIGKTSFAAIMASGLAQLGKKVLLVDNLSGKGRLYMFAHHPRELKTVEPVEELELVPTSHGWDALIAPDSPEELERIHAHPQELHDYIAAAKKSYDVVIFDTTEDFLRGKEYSPFLRYFSNILLLTHPYRGGNNLNAELMERLPSDIAINSISSDPAWDERPEKESEKIFGTWPHMQEFYQLDSDAVQSRGEPLLRMHRDILPGLPLAFLP